MTPFLSPLSSLFSPLLQLHRDDRVLAPKAGAEALFLRAGVAHLCHLLQLQRGALHPAQHHLRQHRKDEPLPLPPRLHLLLHHQRLLLFLFLIRPLHFHIAAIPIPPLLPRGARLLHLKDGHRGKNSGRRSREVMKNWWMYSPNTGHRMLSKNTVFGALTVHSMYIDPRPLTFSTIAERRGGRHELQGSPY